MLRFAGGLAMIGALLVISVAPAQAGKAAAHQATIGRGEASLPASGPVSSGLAGTLVGAHPSTSSGNLTYHGGPVMLSTTTYAIYWLPAGYSFSLQYQALIDGFLGNVAADSGKPTNVYYSTEQYTDTVGHVSGNATFGGSTVDTSPFPASGCTDPRTRVCLDEAQVRSEVTRVMAAQSWTPGLTHLFLLFTPPNVGSCFQKRGQCAYTTYCAYHFHAGRGANTVVYADLPYAAYDYPVCGPGQSPNGDDADATVNFVSAVQSGAITDPTGRGWYDGQGFENQNKCSGNFGTPLGSTTHGQYNQQIGTGGYFIQTEWSNISSACVQQGQ